jgi:AraC family transcriptional regulator, exoenzyme S synthesis regulatory protein ExsA
MDSFFDFIKEHPPVKRLQVNDLLLAEYQCPLAETRYDIWSQHNYFIYVIAGQKKWYTRDQAHLVRKGDCLFVRKGAHSVYQYFDEGFCALVLFLPDSFIRSVLVDNRIHPGKTDDFKGRESLFPIEEDRQIDAYFQSFMSYLIGDRRPDDKLMELKFRELVILTATRCGPDSLTGYFSELCQASMTSLREIMEDNFSYPMSLDEYARLSSRSLSSFKREFKEVFGTSPGKWLRQKRLEHARYLLTHTDKSVTEAAFESGFVNHSHFTRSFRNAFNMTPLECRKNEVVL